MNLSFELDWFTRLEIVEIGAVEEFAHLRLDAVRQPLETGRNAVPGHAQDALRHLDRRDVGQSGTRRFQPVGDPAHRPVQMPDGSARIHRQTLPPAQTHRRPIHQVFTAKISLKKLKKFNFFFFEVRRN